jgi:hypothetical protein
MRHAVRLATPTALEQRLNRDSSLELESLATLALRVDQYRP